MMIITQTPSQKKTTVTQSANSQLEEITQQANARNDNLLDEKTNSTAPSVSLTQLLEQTME